MLSGGHRVLGFRYFCRNLAYRVCRDLVCQSHIVFQCPRINSNRFSSGSIWFQRGAISFVGRIIPGKKSKIDKYEKLWKEFLADPSLWWDNRVDKPNPRFPDFKHKVTGEALWLIDGQFPSGFASDTNFIRPGVSVFSKSQNLGKLNKAGQYRRTLQVFEQMQKDGSRADGHVFVHVLNACTALKSLEEGRVIHEQIIEAGCEFNKYVSSCLVDMYAKCGSIDDAFKVFDLMPTRDVVAWATLILGCVKCGQELKALELFQQMQLEGVEPNCVTFVGVLNACARLSSLQEGKRIHAQIIRSNCESNLNVGNSLVDMYSKCGRIEDAWRVFDNLSKRDVVAWTSMILGCVKCGEGSKALELFRQMQREGTEPDPVTYVGVLNACARIPALEEGRHVHELINRSGCEDDVYIGSSLVDMYAKCGSIEESRKVFDNMPTRNVVAWNAMILGYVKCGWELKALEFFHQMQLEKVDPDPVTFVAILNLCGRVSALEEGNRVHELISRCGYESDMQVGSSLVDMYSKCGRIDKARRMFDKMPERDVVGWNVMIMGYAMHGNAKEARAIFEQMSRVGSEMNDVTFIALLSAFSHGGFVKEGIHYFESMRSVYGVSPTKDHYICMVDILGRAGRLEDAEKMVYSMPLAPSSAVWMSLLAACRIHGNMEMGERASNRLMELDPENASGYALQSAIASAGHWDSKTFEPDERRGIV